MVWADRGEEMAAGQFDRCVEVLSDVKATGMACYALSNMEPESTAFVDDSLGNVQAARALGIHALHFQSAARLRQDLRALGLTELAPA